MSRQSRQATSSVLNPNLTALLDVVLQLITFFMMLVHFGTRLEGATKAVRLPLAPAALPGTEPDFRPHVRGHELAGTAPRQGSRA